MTVTFPISGHRLKRKLSGGIHDSKLASIGRSTLSWLEVNENEDMVRALSLTLQSTAESAVKTVSSQQLDSLVKDGLDTKTAFNYLLAQQGDVCAVAKTTY